METIALIRDISIILFTILWAIAAIVVIVGAVMIFRKVNTILKSVKETIATVQNVAETTLENLVKPMSDSAGSASRVGSVLGFVAGLFSGRKKARG